MVLHEHKEAAKTINEKCDTVNFQTPAKALEIFNTMLAEEYLALMDRIAAFTASSSDVYDIILELRPTNPQIDPDMLEILEYAGIPVPD